MESPFWVRFFFSYTLFIPPPLLILKKNHEQKKSHNCMTESGKMTHLSRGPLGVNGVCQTIVTNKIFHAFRMIFLF
jgi:hypothetical protein